MSNYYLGLTLNDDSVGYAVTDTNYHILKKHGESMWGVHVFDKSVGSEERRQNRSQRRRLARKKRRVELLDSMFKSEILKIDPNFFNRKKESNLKKEDRSTPEKYLIFDDVDFGDPEYYKKYPTIHHLIRELLVSDQPHDIRLVYLACAWLLVHRGHFYSNVSLDNVDGISDIHVSYKAFTDYFESRELPLPWNCDIEEFGNIMKSKDGVRVKTAALLDLFKEKFPKKETAYPYNRSLLVTLLAGGKVKPAELFMKEEYASMKSISLNAADEEFDALIAELGDDGELIAILKGFLDWSILVDLLDGEKYISLAKVKRYEKHKEDLAKLKTIVYKYLKDKYKEIFVLPVAGNYASYSGNITRIKKNNVPLKFKCSYDDFTTFLKKHLKGIECEEQDQKLFDNIMTDIEKGSFLPKQATTENRVIPYQLWYIELKKILENAQNYLPFLNEIDADGFSTIDKLLSIMTFRVPYFVGPTSGTSPFGWIQRVDQDPLVPWKFDQQVDLDATEEAFIRRMTSKCTYMTNKDVLPKNSLIYSAFNVLNTINAIKINGNSISVDAKQAIYNELFLRSTKVTSKQIAKFLVAEGYMQKDDKLSGLPEPLAASLAPFIHFHKYLETGLLHTSEVEDIILRKTLSQDTNRLKAYMSNKYPQLQPDDIQHIASLNYKDYGRLSGEFLTEFIGCDKNVGEAFTILQFMWKTNDNLMQILSNKYTFSDDLAKYNREAFSSSNLSLNDRLNDMMVSSSVRRAISRAMNIVDEIKSVMKCPPERIFIKSARVLQPTNNHSVPLTRAANIRNILKDIKSDDAKQLLKELDDMGEQAEKILQNDATYLYFRQLGRCLYTGEKIALSQLAGSHVYNIDHIIPKSILDDESVTRNLALVSYVSNKTKDRSYPLSEDIQKKMTPYWKMLNDAKLMTNSMFDRLVRTTPLSSEEKRMFIDSYLVENNQTTKALATLLRENLPNTDVVYVKSGLTAEFRNEFKLTIAKGINDLYHAKEAFLNICVGNVYDKRFNHPYFDVNKPYTVRAQALFTRTQKHGEEVFWRFEDLEYVKKVFYRNDIHFTRYSAIKTGAFYKATVQKGDGNSTLMPIKNHMSPEKYGGFTSPTCACFVLASVDGPKFNDEKIIIFIDLIHLNRFNTDPEFRNKYLFEQVFKISGQMPTRVELLLGGRPLKIGTTLLVDGYKFAITGKSSGGKAVGIESMIPFICNAENTKYIKALESLNNKLLRYSKYKPDNRDQVNKDQNLELYDMLRERASKRPFNLFIKQDEVLSNGREIFEKLSLEEQTKALLAIISLFKSCRPGSVDLTLIGGNKNAAGNTRSYKLENWLKTCSSIEIIDESPTGIYRKTYKIM